MQPASQIPKSDIDITSDNTVAFSSALFGPWRILKTYSFMTSFQNIRDVYDEMVKNNFDIWIW